jgi:hypothetical protein
VFSYLKLLIASFLAIKVVIKRKKGSIIDIK